MTNDSGLNNESNVIEMRTPIRWPFWIFWGPLIGVISVLAIIIIWLLIPGNRLFPVGTVNLQLDQSKYLDLINEENKALLSRARQLEAALEESVCLDDGTLLLPDGRTPEGIKPLLNNNSQSSLQETLPNALIPNSPRELVILGESHNNISVSNNGEENFTLEDISPDEILQASPETSTNNQDDNNTAVRLDEIPRDQVGEITLVDLIHMTTVLIFNPNTESVGSGFFISPNHVITNQHNVEGSRGKIFVAGSTLNSGAEATVLSTSGPVEENGDDFALLKLQGVDNPYLDIRVPRESIQLHNVFAAGFPGDVMELVFNEQLGGNLEVMPSVYITEGTVNGETNFGSGNGLLLHSASISQGNSGGPLLDTCGNVLGVNTLIKTSDARTISIALPTKQLVKFLTRNNLNVNVEEGKCVPLVSQLEAPKIDDSVN